MKNLVKFIKESSITDNFLVRFAQCKRDAGIMFEGENGEYEPEDVKAICEAVGLEYSDEDMDSLNVPVYFWNITRNVTGWVERGDCKDLL